MNKEVIMNGWKRIAAIPSAVLIVISSKVLILDMFSRLEVTVLPVLVRCVTRRLSIIIRILIGSMAGRTMKLLLMAAISIPLLIC